MEDDRFSQIPTQPTVLEQFLSDVDQVYQMINTEMKNLEERKKEEQEQEKKNQNKKLNKKKAKAADLQKDIIKDMRVVRRTRSHELSELLIIFIGLKENFIYEDNYQKLINSTEPYVLSFVNRYAERLLAMVTAREMQFGLNT